MTIENVEEYKGIAILEAMECAKSYNQNIINELISCIEQTGNKKCILDFGAGRGPFALELKRKNKEVICLEVDHTLRKILKHQNFEVVGNLEADERYDFIYSVNVLEHIENDWTAIDNIYSALKERGGLWLYIPAFPILFSSFDRKLGHFRRYDKVKLINNLQKIGFTIVKCHYADSLGFLMALGFKYLGPRHGNITHKQIALYDRYLFPISKIMDYLFSRFFGKNLVVYAIKNHNK